jgi:hypothetical protein
MPLQASANTKALPRVQLFSTAKLPAVIKIELFYKLQMHIFPVEFI